MEKVIRPIERHLLKAELANAELLRRPNRGNNEIYVVEGCKSPAVMQEIGRLRELAFRAWGGGTGKEADIDEFDMIPGLYRQLIIWNPEDEAILGGYRFSFGRHTPYTPDGQPMWASAEYFTFSEDFIRTIMPYTIELGRSFVSNEYQASNIGAKSIFALNNLWDGLLTLVASNPYVRYFFGKMTMYNQYNRIARSLILTFLDAVFPSEQGLIEPKYPVYADVQPDMLRDMFAGGSFNDSYRVLKQQVRNQGVNIPPLINAYMKLTSQMQVFGTSNNADFGNVEETAILIHIPDISQETLKRHLSASEFEKWQSSCRMNA